MFSDEQLKIAAKEFVFLDQTQRAAIENMNEQDNTIKLIYADKALTFSIMTSWAYVAGVLHSNPVRLQRHYDLRNTPKERDPLNAEAMAKGRHRSDPENYRGLGTRNDAKERGRCVELFYLQAEKGTGITPALVDAAIKRRYTKQAKLVQLQAEKKV
jgi:plasmid maintenance system antidote protein VapI